MTGQYILKGKIPVLEPDLNKWETWYERSIVDGSRIVGNFEHGGVRISTVFLGIDHNFRDDGPPLIFETMIFGGPNDGEQWRFSTWEDAEAHHMMWCRMMIKGEKNA